MGPFKSLCVRVYRSAFVPDIIKHVPMGVHLGEIP